MALTDRARRLLIGTGVTIVGLVLILVGYALVPPMDPGWPAVGAGLLVLAGFITFLAGALLWVTPALLPSR